MARHLYHQCRGEKTFVVVSNSSLLVAKRNRRFKVFAKSTYTSHWTIKKKYPYEVFRYE